MGGAPCWDLLISAGNAADTVADTGADQGASVAYR